jgi:hypothetical protein
MKNSQKTIPIPNFEFQTMKPLNSWTVKDLRLIPPFLGVHIKKEAIAQYMGVSFLGHPDR